MICLLFCRSQDTRSLYVKSCGRSKRLTAANDLVFCCRFSSHIEIHLPKRRFDLDT